MNVQDFQEAFVILYSPVIAILLAAAVAGTVVVAILRVVIAAVSPRQRRVYRNIPEWGGEERR